MICRRSCPDNYRNTGILWKKASFGSGNWTAAGRSFLALTFSLIRVIYNMTDYTKYLEDTVWCNDRSISTLNGWSPNDGSTIEYDFLRFSSYDRNYDYTPSFECRDIDSFTLKVEKGGTAGYGNNKLDYPVGLLTADELTYAGAKARTENTNYYLSTGQTYHLLSPYRFGDNSAAVFYVYENGMLRSSYRVNSKYGIRPTISLKPDIVYTMGNGTPSNPYVIKLEQ